MTVEEVCNMIVDNKCKWIQVFDWNENKLFQIDAASPDKATKLLQDRLQNISGYKRINVLCKVNPGDNIKHSYYYNVELSSGKKDESSVSGKNNFGIGATEHVNAIIGMMEKNNALLQENMKLQFSMKQNDPTQWMPVIREAIGFLRGESGASQIAGANKLVTDRKEKTNLSQDEIIKEMDKEFTALTKNVNQQQYLDLLRALNKIDNVKENINKINSLIEKIAEEPELLDMAVKYIK